MTSRPATRALVILLLLRAAAAGATAPGPSVTVREPDGVERHHWPLTVSVPFARGELTANAAVHAVDEHGRALPTQTRSLARWPDGSVRWLLIDTQIDLAPRQEHHLRIEPGAPPGLAAPLHAALRDDRIEVDTGALSFTVPKHRFAIVDGVRIAGTDTPLVDAVGSTLVVGERSGAAQPPHSLTITENGPLRSRIELRGSYGSDFDYLIRVEAYAGQPFVRVWHTFTDRHPTPYVSLPRLSVELPLGALKPSSYRFGVDSRRPRGAALGNDGVHLYQIDNTAYAVDGSRSDGQLAGWVELETRRARVGIAARWFWQEYPQSFAARRDALVYNLWAPEAEAAKVGVGASKTHEFVLWVAPPRGLAKDAGGSLARPLVGVVDPAWVARTGALPQALAPAGIGERFVRSAMAAARRYLQRNDREPWNDCGEVTCTAPGADRPRVGAYGMFNWGDWNFRGYEDSTKGSDSWGNLEYDTALVLALTYAASGDPDLFDAMQAAARHFIDVDTIAACPARPEWVGMNHPKSPLHFSFELGGPDLGHTWVQGSLAYYYLTGDERGLAAARAIADYLSARLAGVVRGNPRQWGWPQIALLAVYDATGERAYLNAARLYASGGMRAHPPTTSAQWKLGILADALAYTHAASGDPAIKDWLERYVGAVMQRKGSEDVRAFPAVAYLASTGGAAELREAALTRAQGLDLGSWGKPFSINGRIGFRIYSLLAGPPAAVAAPHKAR